MDQPHIEQESRLILFNKLNALEIQIVFLLKNNPVLSVSLVVELGPRTSTPTGAPQRLSRCALLCCCGVRVSFLHAVMCEPLTWHLLSSLLCFLITHPPPLSSLSWSQAKVDNEIIDYRDLAAIPRVKAIYDIEHPDMISYETVNGTSTLEKRRNRQDSQSVVKVTYLWMLWYSAHLMNLILD